MTDDELKRLFDAMRQENTAAHTETRQQFEDVARRFDSMQQENTAAQVETRQQFEDVARRFDSMQQENTAAHAETRRQVEQTAAATRYQLDIAVEHFTKRFDLLAESIMTVDEKLDRKTADLEERMERGFAETQAMIKSFTPNWIDAYAPSKHAKSP